jgi:hypothetical protein
MKRPHKKQPKVRQCGFCGCTDDAACPGGCFWADQETCSRCAKVYHAGEIHALAGLAELLSQSKAPSIPTDTLLEVLGRRATNVQTMLEKLHPDFPLQEPAAPIEFGKGKRSSDALEAATGAGR